MYIILQYILTTLYIHVVYLFSLTKGRLVQSSIVTRNELKLASHSCIRCTLVRLNIPIGDCDNILVQAVGLC